MNWTESSIRLADAQAQKWDENNELWKQGPRAEMLQFFYDFAPAPGLKVLDLGCGPGESSRLMKERGYEAVGVDQSPKMIEAALKREVEAYVSDCAPLPFADGTFDGVFACTSLEWSEQPHKIVKEIARVVKPGGFLVAVTLGPSVTPRRAAYRRLYGEPVVHNSMMPWELRSLLEEHGFACKDMRGAYSRQADGPDERAIALLQANWIHQASIAALWAFGMIKQ